MAERGGNPHGMPIGRRTFLRGIGATAAAGWIAPAVIGSSRTAARAAVAKVDGTTLATTFVPTGPGPYRRLIEGPGQPVVVRAIGSAEPKVGREDRRVAVASIVHLTDVHVIDAQSPARVEFLDRYSDPPSSSIPFSSAFRPQETLTTQVAESMVRRVNELKRGPATGRKFDCAVSTGDNIDNQQQNEMEWFITLLDGGTVRPDSGGNGYEGVQDQNPLTFDPHYWHPDDEDPTRDFYKRYHGFPAYPGLLAAAAVPFTASGLDVPWFTVNGNHDGLVQGNAPANATFEEIATGSVKVVNLPAGMSPGDFQTGLTQQDPAVLAALAVAPARPTTPDAKRRFVTPKEWATAHFGSTRPGPRGHGLTQENVDKGTLYYAFEIAPAVTGIVLDSVNRAGYAEGSLDPVQFAWLEEQLKKASARYFDAAGTEVRTSAADRLVVLFSHHSLVSMTNPFPDPTTGGQRVLGTQIEALLHRFPNVVLWVNGHSHENRVTPRPDSSGRTGGFWEILTAAHVDYPQQARLVEIADNRDGTLSIFGTIIEHAAPAAAAAGSTDVLSLAAISRELSANDFQVNLATALGTPEHRNVELLVKAPFDVAPSASDTRRGAGADAGAGTGAAPGGDRGDGQARGAESLAATGSAFDARLGLGAAALGAALALRRRRESADDHVS